MAAKSQLQYDYVAHVQKDDGKIIELAGTKEDWSVKHVYQWLWEQAQAMSGWLLADKITEAGAVSASVAEPEGSDSTYYSTSSESEPPPTSPDEGTPIGDALHWGLYLGNKYTGATRISFKEDKK